MKSKLIVSVMVIEGAIILGMSGFLIFNHGFSTTQIYSNALDSVVEVKASNDTKGSFGTGVFVADGVFVTNFQLIFSCLWVVYCLCSKNNPYYLYKLKKGLSQTKTVPFPYLNSLFY